MDSARHHLIQTIFLDALDLPESSRLAFLESVCRGDAALRLEVDSLLDAERGSGAFLEPVFSLRSALHVQAETPRVDPMIGATVSAYRIVRVLGEGGMGRVYLAEDARRQHPVALKFLRPELNLDRDAAARLRREARAGASLDHPNICSLYGIEETPDGHLFIAMAYYDGETLSARLPAAPLPIAETLDIVRQVGRGLAAAHAAGIIHRDVKPSNIMIVGSIAKVLDFGIARLEDQSSVTTRGMKLGTAAYASPEQAAAATIDHRTDIWSLGVVMYEMLTGRRPYDVRSFATMPGSRGMLVPVSRFRPDTPAALDRVLGRSLALSADDRYPSMSAFVDELEMLTRTHVGPRRGAAPVPADLSAQLLDRGHIADARVALRIRRAAAMADTEDAATQAAFVEAAIRVAELSGDWEPGAEPATIHAALQRAKATGPHDASVLLAAAETSLILDADAEAAAALLRRALAAAPEDHRTLVRLSESLLRLDRMDEAAAMARRAVLGAERSPAMVVKAGRVLSFAGDPAAGGQALASVVAQGPAVALLDLAVSLALGNDAFGAEEALDRAIADAGCRALITAVLGNGARANGDLLTYERARRLIRGPEIVTVEPIASCLLDVEFGRLGRPLEFLEPADRSGLGRFVGLLGVAGSRTALTAGCGLIAYLDLEPALDPLRHAARQRLPELSR